ncbi:MAG: hypothetical protein Hyperionvirus15_50 [Hyperionvirus sp.]|uniref:Uncharacterized protein n=1 Tax=Hyperionvirus sp. TaxID=2487770 RepID=A0A3G5AA99_9VIRU|nr:MAG: hypothetical protein Hyperionvirus15_50 [Hyperionvirus sp.]
MASGSTPFAGLGHLHPPVATPVGDLRREIGAYLEGETGGIGTARAAAPHPVHSGREYTSAFHPAAAVAVRPDAAVAAARAIAEWKAMYGDDVDAFKIALGGPAVDRKRAFGVPARSAGPRVLHRAVRRTAPAKTAAKTAATGAVRPHWDSTPVAPGVPAVPAAARRGRSVAVATSTSADFDEACEIAEIADGERKYAHGSGFTTPPTRPAPTSPPPHELKARGPPPARHEELSPRGSISSPTGATAAPSAPTVPKYPVLGGMDRKEIAEYYKAIAPKPQPVPVDETQTEIETKINDSIRHIQRAGYVPVILVIGSDPEEKCLLETRFPSTRVFPVHKDSTTHICRADFDSSHARDDLFTRLTNASYQVAAISFGGSSFKLMTRIDDMFRDIEKNLASKGVYIGPMQIFRGGCIVTDNSEPTISLLNQVSIPRNFSAEKQTKLMTDTRDGIFTALKSIFARADMYIRKPYPFFENLEGIPFKITYFVAQKA